MTFVTFCRLWYRVKRSRFSGRPQAQWATGRSVEEYWSDKLIVLDKVAILPRSVSVEWQNRLKRNSNNSRLSMSQARQKPPLCGVYLGDGFENMAALPGTLKNFLWFSKISVGKLEDGVSY